MATYKYGELIDGYSVEKEQVYLSFIEYFDNPMMTKIKDNESYSLYIAKIECHLIIEFKYVVAIIPKSFAPIKHTIPLSELKWVSLQTRYLPDNYEIPIQEYNWKRNSFSLTPIEIIKKDSEYYKYDCKNLPIEVTLLNTKTDGTQYVDKGTLISAIETYRTIITFKKSN